MIEIKCPNCNEIIKIEKDKYNALLNDIEKEEIETRVKERMVNLEKTFKAQYELKASEINHEKTNQINDLKTEIALLNEKLNNKDQESKLIVAKAIEELKDQLMKKNETITKLQSDVDNAKKEADFSVQKVKEKYEFDLKIKDDEIKKWKDYRMGDSTKDLGESLEQYCSDAFNEIRANVYPNAYFEKDNVVDETGKGDFIFKDYQDGEELVSIMFEMKTEKDTTVSKHKNEEFLKKLDKNRTSKNCEYAVLVTTLESDSKLYNTGIVDVSYKYPKMYIVRPQFFLTIIALIRNMAKSSFSYKKQVLTYQKENIDITTFEEAVKAVALKITDDYERANKIYSQVDVMCDGFIKKIEDFRKEFKTAAGWIEKATKQLPNLEIRKLTRGNATMKEKFAQLEKNKEKIIN